MELFRLGLCLFKGTDGSRQGFARSGGRASLLLHFLSGPGNGFVGSPGRSACDLYFFICRGKLLSGLTALLLPPVFLLLEDLGHLVPGLGPLVLQGLDDLLLKFRDRLLDLVEDLGHNCLLDRLIKHLEQLLQFLAAQFVHHRFEIRGGNIKVHPVHLLHQLLDVDVHLFEQVFPELLEFFHLQVLAEQVVCIGFEGIDDLLTSHFPRCLLKLHLRLFPRQLSGLLLQPQPLLLKVPLHQVWDDRGDAHDNVQNDRNDDEDPETGADLALGRHGVST